MTIFYPPVQQKLFIVMLVLGAAIGMLYDIFRVKRRFFGENRVVLFIDDVLFSLISVTAFLFAIFVVNNGIFRWFEAFLTLLGFFLYRVSVSRLVIFVLFGISDAIIFALKCLFRLTLFPFKLLYSLLSILVLPLKRKRLLYYKKHEIYKFCKKSLTGKCKSEKK